MNPKKIIGGLALLLLGLLSLNAQKTVQLDYFDEIVATGAVNITLQKGTNLAAVVKVDKIDVDDVNISVSEGVLKIEVLRSLIKKNPTIDVVVTCGKLRRIKAQAGADIESNEVFVGDLIELRANSGAEIELKVEVNKLEAHASEGSHIKITGKTQTQDIRSSSGANIAALQLDCDNTYANANTGGIAKVVAKQNLEASANTGGVVKYKGKPAKTKMKELLSGKVVEL